MSNEDQIYQRIEKYLNGQLSGDELTSFKKELGQNESLNKKAEAHRLANEMVIEYRLQNVKAILHQEKINYGRKNIWKKIISGITGGLILATLLFFLIHKENPNNEQLTSSRSKQNTINNKDAFIDYKEDKSIKPQTSNSFNNPAIIENQKKENNVVTYKDTSFLKNEQNSEPTVINNEISKVNDEPIVHKQASVPTNSCEQVDITYHLSIKPSCEGEENGSIIISGFKGGTAPYHYYVSHNNHELTHFNLPAGSYNIIIKDSKGCLKNLPDLEVPEKHCPKDYSFNPSLGETWEIPSYKNSGTLILYDEGGIVYFTEEIGAGAKQQWSGQSKNGEMKTGYFLFVINYKDGTSKHGSVTIVH